MYRGEITTVTRWFFRPFIGVRFNPTYNDRRFLAHLVLDEAKCWIHLAYLEFLSMKHRWIQSDPVKLARDLTRPKTPPKGSLIREIPFSGKSRLVKYYSIWPDGYKVMVVRNLA